MIFCKIYTLRGNYCKIKSENQSMRGVTSMIFEKDELLISSRSKKLLKVYLGFIIVDVIGILFLNNVFVDFDIYEYTLIRVMCIVFSILICMVKQVLLIGGKLVREYKYIFNELDTDACDDDGDVTEDQWASIKRVLKIILAAIETCILFYAQSKAIVYFRKRFYDVNGLNIVICLVMMGTLMYLSRNYLNKKYCI